jgi:hypothetical protein
VFVYEIVTFLCSFQELEVYSDVDGYAGSVIQDWTILDPLFQLKDSNGQVIYRLKGPASAATCCGSNYQATFDVSIVCNLNYNFNL